jgi:NADH dehydrogenase (ubiquinone) Fe-S protein 4
VRALCTCICIYGYLTVGLTDGVAVMPFHASERVFPSVEDAPMPFPSEVSLLTGTEEWMKGRKVRIFKPARHQMQSGTYNTKHWEIRFEKNRTWENPLMGWTSTKDMTHQLDSLLKFDTAEEAQAYAEKHGWEMELEEPAALGDFSGKISYSHNFLPLDIENMVKREGKKSHVQFKHPTGRRSNWVKTLKYHGDGVVAQHGGEAKE